MPDDPIDASEYRPEGAEGLTYASHLHARDDVQSWSHNTAEWVDGANGCESGYAPHTIVWWRWTPDPSNPVRDLVAKVQTLTMRITWNPDHGEPYVRVPVSEAAEFRRMADAIELEDES